MTSSSSIATLGYWKIRGLAQSIRTLLVYTGTPFEDKFYGDGDAEEARWQQDKKAMASKFLFPNLPFYECGDVKLTQSLAIMRHIGRKHGLCGSGPIDSETESRMDEWIYQIIDFRRAMSACVYSSDPPVEEFAKDKAGVWLAGFENAIGEHLYVAGPLTIADFMFVEVLLHVRACFAAKAGIPDALALFPRLSALVARFEALPRISDYLASKAVFMLPFNGESAVFR